MRTELEPDSTPDMDPEAADDESGPLGEIRDALLGRQTLVRAIGSGRRRGADAPAYHRVTAPPRTGMT